MPLRTHALLFSACALALAAASCSPAAQAPAPATALPLSAAISLGTAQLTTAGGEYTAVGTVRARTAAAVAARVSGYVSAVHVHLGDRVRAGQTLIELATPEAGDQVTAAQAGLAAARAQLSAARRRQASAEAQAGLAHSTYQRYAQLQREHSVSPHEFDQVAAADRSAAASLAAVQAGVQAAAQGVQQAQAALSQARSQAGYATLVAPFAGVVTAKSVEVGDLALPGAPLLRIEGPGGFDLEASVPERYLAGLRAGQPVEATFSSLPLPALHARIREISPASDPVARAAIVKVALPEAPGLRSGLYGEIVLPTAGENARILVPAAAILQSGELNEMYVAAAGGAELRLVTVGATSGGRIEVLSGLSPGERFVRNAAAYGEGRPHAN